MIYKLYIKADGEDAGQVLAIIGHHESNVIDQFEVYRITNGVPAQVEVFMDKDIKMHGEGRPLWSEVTWEKNGKWTLLETTIDLDVLTTEIKADPSAANVAELIPLLSKN